MYVLRTVHIHSRRRTGPPAEAPERQTQTQTRVSTALQHSNSNSISISVQQCSSAPCSSRRRLPPPPSNSARAKPIWRIGSARTGTCAGSWGYIAGHQPASQPAKPARRPELLPLLPGCFAQPRPGARRTAASPFSHPRDGFSRLAVSGALGSILRMYAGTDGAADTEHRCICTYIPCLPTQRQQPGSVCKWHATTEYATYTHTHTAAARVRVVVVVSSLQAINPAAREDRAKETLEPLPRPALQARTGSCLVIVRPQAPPASLAFPRLPLSPPPLPTVHRDTAATAPIRQVLPRSSQHSAG